MTATESLDVGPERVVRVGRTEYPVVLPRPGDARLHIAAIIISIHVLGQVALEFRVSIPQILAAMLTAAVLDVSVVFLRSRRLVWPASAMLTGSGVGLILRDVDTEAGEHWATRQWWLFAGVAALSLAFKYLIRWRGSQVFNPSNAGLVVTFLVLGSGRVEPLDFWWGPFDAWMLLAYGLILVGGLLITARLDLLGMVLAFWSTFAACTGSLALAGHCIIAAWSINPVCDTHFWWVVVTSPEVLVFVFFMITDPRTVPAAPRSRILFGAAVGATSSVLLAPFGTEFGAKVALLSGLMVMSALRPVLASLLDRSGVADRVRRLSIGSAPRPSRAVGVGFTIVASAVVLVGVAAAGAPARTAGSVVDAEELPEPVISLDEITADRVPDVTVDPEVGSLDARLVEPAVARDIGLALVRAVAVEAEALRRADPELLAAVDRGRRLVQMEELVAAGTAAPVTVPEYDFEIMHLTVARVGPQTGSQLGVEARGRVVEVSYDENRNEVERSEASFAVTFALEETSDGRWLVADARPLESGAED